MPGGRHREALQAGGGTPGPGGCAPHSLDHSEMFMELHREEKREEGDRGGQEDKGGNLKERDRCSQQSVS